MVTSISQTDLKYLVRFVVPYPYGSMTFMSPMVHLTKAQRKLSEELGRIGGQTRAKNLTPKRRLEIARKASKAAAKARTLKARERKGGD
jgi:hypothetical protein